MKSILNSLYTARRHCVPVAARRDDVACPVACFRGEYNHMPRLGLTGAPRSSVGTFVGLSFVFDSLSGSKKAALNQTSLRHRLHSHNLSIARALRCSAGEAQHRGKLSGNRRTRAWLTALERSGSCLHGRAFDVQDLPNEEGHLPNPSGGQLSLGSMPSTLFWILAMRTVVFYVL